MRINQCMMESAPHIQEIQQIIRENIISLLEIGMIMEVGLIFGPSCTKF